MTEIIGAALQGSVRGMYMMGENPFLSDPNVNKVRKALSALEFLVVQDIFLTETSEFADVVLPASSYMEKDGTYTNTDRRVQIGRKVLEPPGEAREDWKIICDIATRIGLPMDYASPSEIFDELESLMPNYAGLSYDNLGETGKLYPNPDPEHSDGTVVLFDERFGTDDGKAHLVPAEWLPAKELPDDEFPFILNTGRLLEHWHTGSMTRRSYALDTIQPEAHVFLNPDDAAEMGVGRRRLRARHEPARLDRAERARLAPRHARHLLRAVPLPRGRRERADDRRDRPDREDPGVQVLRGARGAGRVSAVPGAEARAGRFPGPSLIPDLHEIQREHGWLPREELVTLSRERRRPLYEIEGLISFYPHFRTAPPAAAEVACCHDLSCWLRGSDERIEELRADPSIEFREVSCIGRCDMAPAASSDTTSVRRSEVQRPNDPYEPDARDYRVLREALAGERDMAELIEELKESGLRGMGGAGFPTGTKWELVAKQEADAEVRDLQRRRVRARHLQGPPDPRRAAAPRARGPRARDARDRLHGGLGVHPARVRAGGGGAARGAGAPARPGPARRGGRRAWTSSPPPAATSSARSRR